MHRTLDGRRELRCGVGCSQKRGSAGIARLADSFAIISRGESRSGGEIADNRPCVTAAAKTLLKHDRLLKCAHVPHEAMAYLFTLLEQPAGTDGRARKGVAACRLEFSVTAQVNGPK